MPRSSGSEAARNLTPLVRSASVAKLCMLKRNDHRAREILGRKQHYVLIILAIEQRARCYCLRRNARVD